MHFARAGAFFPDAFYGCRGQDEAAEAAHWPPFLAQGVRLVQEKQLRGDTEGALNLNAFLYGVLSHQVADISWHSLGISQGLLQVMAQTEFGGDTDSAHTTLDAGGDFIYLHGLFASEKSYEWIQQDWDYDSDDIISILSDLGYRGVTPFQVNYCMSRGRAALSGEMKIADPAYIHYAQKSPLLFGSIEDYYAGGIAEMQSTTTECMRLFAGWHNELPADAWDLCQVFDGKRPAAASSRDKRGVLTRFAHGIHSFHSYLQIKPAIQKKLGEDTVVVSGGELWSHFGKSVIWWPSAQKWIVSAPQQGRVHFLSSEFDLENAVQGPQKLEGLYHARFGQALTVVAIANKEYLAVSSPGLSRIDFFNKNAKHVGGLKWAKAQKVFGKRGVKLVGESLLFDIDSSILYVGAPYSDIGPHAQTGSVYIIDSKILAKAVKGHVVDADNAHVIEHEPASWTKFGAKMSYSNMFLLIGSPGNSVVYGYDRLTHGRLLVLSGPDKSGFGGHMLSTSENKIAVGAPYHNPAGEQSGGVFMWEFTRRTQLHGDSAYGRFGHAGTMYGNKLYIGSPFAQNMQGAVWTSPFGMSDPPKIVATGPEPFNGRFCEVVATNGTWIACGSPMQDDRGAVVFIST